MKIKLLTTFGIAESMLANGYPMIPEDKINEYRKKHLDNGNVIDRIDTSNRLGTVPVGSGHDTFLNGIIVQMDLTCPIKMWTEMQRYHFVDFVSSSSTMHTLTKVTDLKGIYDEHVDPRIIPIMEELIKQYNENKTEDNFLKVVMSNPCGMELTARITTNYRQLKTIYYQRKDHRLPDWRQFCEYIKSYLPYFETMVLGE